MDMKWYIVYTKSGSEKKVSDILNKRKIENYIPFNKTGDKWSDSKNIKETSLFKNYIFIKTAEEQLYDLKKINNVISLVYWMGKPVNVKDVEIEAIKLFLKEYTAVTIQKATMKSSEKAGSVGHSVAQEMPSITIKNKKASLRLPSLGYVLNAAAETTNVRIISAEGVLNSSNVKSGNIFNKVTEINNSLKNYWVKALSLPIFLLLF